MTKLSSRGNESGQKKTGALLFFHSSYSFKRLVRVLKADEDREKILLSKFNVIFEFGTDCRNLQLCLCVAMDLSKQYTLFETYSKCRI